VSAVLGAGMHPDRKLYVSNPRIVNYSDFKPTNKYKEGSTEQS
jgi:dihydroxy-acid dehydratase